LGFLLKLPHVFSYSEREGTPAARIPNIKQVPVNERKQRNKELRELGEELRSKLYQSQIGSQAWVLPERRDGNVFTGRAEDYSHVKIQLDQKPDGLEQTSADNIQLGKWIKVRYQAADAQHLIGFVDL